MNSGYQEILKSLERKSYSASLTLGVVGLFLISLLLLAVAIFCSFLQTNNQSILPIFVVSLASGALGFFGSLIWYLMKSREYVRIESIELNMKYPGFYDYYQQRQAKLDEITTSPIAVFNCV
jgi:O-antigen/teichoic acid export membrane protein